MELSDSESAWEDLGYQAPSYTVPSEQKIERSVYKKELANKCLDELRRMLREKNDL